MEMILLLYPRMTTKDPTDLGLEDTILERYTDMWAIVDASLKADTGTLLQENTSKGDPRGVAKLTNPHEYYVYFSIHMNQRRDLLNEANALLILPSF